MLVETWTNQKSNIDLPNYTPFPMHRPKRNIRAKRDSGGIIMYIRNDIMAGFELFCEDMYDCLWLKMKKEFFHLSRDIMLCLCYVVPQNSSHQGHLECETFDKIVNRIIELSSNQEEDLDFIVAGDLNGRVPASVCDYIVNDDIRYLPLVDDVYIPDEAMVLPRYNEDTVLNEHGKKVIDMCKMCGIRIVNGRIGDLSNSSLKTFVGPMGSSTVDLVLCNPKMFDMFKKFHISPITEFSDHKYIEFSLKVNYEKLEESSISESFRLKWKNDKMQEFVENIKRESCASKLLEMCEIIDQNIMNESQVNKALDLFVEAVHKAADPLFLKRNNNNIIENNESIKNKYPCWATDEWVDAKSNFRRHCDIYNRNPSDENRLLMVASRKLYKNLSWKCRRNFDMNQTNKLYQARIKNAKEYWKMIKSVKRKDSVNVTCDEFKRYFDDLYNPEDEFYTPDPEIVDRVKDMIEEDIIEMFNVLNLNITEEEVNSAIKQLKRNKASGSDLLINELFMYSQNEFTSYITKLFNFVFDSGIFPSNWSEGLLVPLHKKGDLNSPSNFRGIVLLSVLGKLFTRVLNTRLNIWAEEYGVYVEAQNGF